MTAPARPIPASLLRLCGLALALGAIATSAEVAIALDLGETFPILDDDGDGVVRREEFLRTKTLIFYRALPNLEGGQQLSPEQLNVTPQAFADADLDGDGRLSGAEFVQARFMQFDAMDANGDHEITQEEFRAFIAEFLERR